MSINGDVPEAATGWSGERAHTGARWAGLSQTAAWADSASARGKQVGGRVAGCCLLLWMVAARCTRASELSCTLKTGTLFVKVKIPIKLMKRSTDPRPRLRSRPSHPGN